MPPVTKKWMRSARSPGRCQNWRRTIGKKGLKRHEEREEDHEAEGEAGGIPEFGHGSGDGRDARRVTR